MFDFVKAPFVDISGVMVAVETGNGFIFQVRHFLKLLCEFNGSIESPSPQRALTGQPLE